MKAITALFVGGPEDGKIRTVRDEFVHVAAMDPGARYVHADPLGRSFGVGFDEVSFRTHTYRRESLALFGRHLDVYVYDGVRGREERDGLAMRHLLSDVALGLVGGRS